MDSSRHIILGMGHNLSHANDYIIFSKYYKQEKQKRYLKMYLSFLLYLCSQTKFRTLFLNVK